MSTVNIGATRQNRTGDLLITNLSNSKRGIVTDSKYRESEIITLEDRQGICDNDYYRRSSRYGNGTLYLRGNIWWMAVSSESGKRIQCSTGCRDAVDAKKVLAREIEVLGRGSRASYIDLFTSRVMGILECLEEETK